MLYHIAATTGNTVAELKDKISYSEYAGWSKYFEYINGGGEKSKGVTEQDSGALLKEFGL